MCRLKTTILFCSVLLALQTRTAAGTPALLQATLKDVTCEGRLVSRDNEFCLLMGRDGRLFRIKIDSIQKLESIAPKFRKYTAAELRDQLRREHGKEMDVVGTGHYLVCAPRASAARYARVFEEIYRDVHLYFSRRGFRVEEPEFPLVAVVYPDPELFAVQCRKDDVRFGPGLLGYYHPGTNRVALFDSSGEESTGIGSRSPDQSSFAQSTASSFEGLFPTRSRGNGLLHPRDLLSSAHGEIAAATGAPSGNDPPTLEEIMSHETIHQVAFNIGLHSRIGENPKWVVEGLATALEVPGMHTSAPTDTVRDRANHYRLVWFEKYAKTRRKPNSLVEFISRDNLYALAPPDAYAEGWALTFFLLETRPGKYSGLLRTIAARDPNSPYTADERLNDFRNAFGGNFELLEAEFLRFIERLQ